MKNKLALVVAIVLGAVAIIGILQYAEQTREEQRDQYMPRRVAAAAQRLKAGTVIEMQMLDPQGKEVVEDSITQDHVLQNSAHVLLGRTLNRDVEAGEPLLKSYFSQPVVYLEDKLRTGERAVTLSVDAVTGVAGNITPGSHVDIVATLPLTETGERATGSAAGGLTRYLLSNVTVLAVDSRTQQTQYLRSSGAARAGAYNSVTVAVHPSEAPLLVHAQSIGTLTMILRTPADAEMPTPPEPIDATNLLERVETLDRERRRRIEEETAPDLGPRP